MPDENQIDYILKGIPRELWQRAKDKAATYRPPIALRWVLISLLEKWVEAERQRPTPPKQRKGKAPKATGTAKKRQGVAGSATTPRAAAPSADAPDLGDVF